MPKNLTRRRLCAGLSLPLLWHALPGLAQPAPTLRARSDPLRVGFVYVSPVGSAGWTYQHDLGRQEMQQRLGARVQTTVVENVREGPDSERVMRDLAQQGHGLIMATSFGYLEPALRVAREFPEVAFEHAGGFRTAPNLNTYNARHYEGRYLAGVLAGLVSRSGMAGYLAGFPVPEVLQGLNAFTRGMRSVRPDAQVRVLWLSTWFDPPRERDGAQTLVNLGADILTHHTASPAVAQAAQALGVPVIPYHSDMRAFAPTQQLCAVTHHWGAHYTRVAQDLLEGRWSAQPVWGGMREGFVRLTAVADQLPADAAAQVRAREREIVEGRLHPFAAPVTDASGQVRLAQGMLPDEAIQAMDYAVQGVVGGVPGR